MTEGKQVNELAWKTRIHFDKLLDRGFSHGQITIMNIMISIDRYSEEHGPGSSFSIMAACFNAVMSGGNVDITKINGYTSKSIPNAENTVMASEILQNNMRRRRSCLELMFHF